MVSQVITVERKKYATGLFWQPVVGTNANNYARSLAKNVEKKYSLYVEYRNMVGLSSRRSGAHFGMPSAAIEIIESLSEYVSFLAAFQTNNGFYILAIRNGIIIHDELISSSEDARRQYVDLSAIPDWGILIAPEQWMIPRSKEILLSDVIHGANIKSRLLPISIFQSGLSSFVLIGIFVLFIVFMLKTPIAKLFIPNNVTKIDPELVQEYKKQIEEKKQELEQQYIEEDVKPMVYPYDSLPDKNQRAELCYKAMGFLMQPISGWNQVYTKCDETHVSATFSRDYGSMNDFYNIGKDLIPGVVVQEVSDNEIIVKAKLPELETKSSLEERDVDTVIRDVTTVFQLLNNDFEISSVTDTITNGEKTENINVVEISASSKLIPSEFIQIFKDFEGVYVTSITWNVKTRVWNYDVVIYTK